MNEKDLYELLQEKLDASIEMPDASIWEGIRSKMARRHRMMVVSRVSFIQYNSSILFCSHSLALESCDLDDAEDMPSIRAISSCWKPSMVRLKTAR